MTAEFGAAVKRWRDRAAPADAGLSAGGRRRAAGLRREELAMLAGISVDYVTRLEQGRATSPSAQVVEALARALRLGSQEREHLFRLAGLMPPGRGTVPTHVTPSVLRLLDRLDGTPVAVHDAAWNLLVTNRLWTALMGDHSGRRGFERNIIWRHYLGSGSRVVPAPEHERSFKAAMVADLRTAAARYPADVGLARMIAELRAGSAKFAELWESGVVGGHEAARKRIENPQVGPLTLDCDVLTVAGADLRIVAYTAEPGTQDADRLALLAVVGTQSLVGEVGLP
jgi:transcriptional regulator with XRE-family HTH domain